jgi:hypothetical protein
VSTLVSYESNGPRQLGEVVLDDGSRIRVSLGADGATIERLPTPGVAQALLFQASPDLAAWIAVSLREGADAASPILVIFLELVVRLGSVAAIRSAFAGAAATYRDFSAGQ